MATLAMKGRPRAVGRPKCFTDAEEEKLNKGVVSLRRHGLIVDRETLLVMAIYAVKKSRGADCDVPPLTAHWVKGYKYVHCHGV